MIQLKKLSQDQHKPIFVFLLTYLLINLPKIGKCVISLEGSIEAFIGLGIVVPGDTFCNNMVEEV